MGKAVVIRVFYFRLICVWVKGCAGTGRARRYAPPPTSAASPAGPLLAPGGLQTRSTWVDRLAQGVQDAPRPGSSNGGTVTSAVLTSVELRLPPGSRRGADTCRPAGGSRSASPAA